MNDPTFTEIIQQRIRTLLLVISSGVGIIEISSDTALFSHSCFTFLVSIRLFTTWKQMGALKLLMEHNPGVHQQTSVCVPMVL